MFSATPLTVDERRRRALVMAQLRVARLSTNSRAARRLPAALPCHDYEKAFANVVVPMGVVEMSDAEELEPWLLVARPVTRKEAEKKGGCIRFTPSTINAKSKSSSSVKPQYYCITDSDDEVYGRATYLPRAQPATALKKAVSTVSLNLSTSSSNVYTEEDLEEAEERSRNVTPKRNNSYLCVVRA